MSIEAKEVARANCGVSFTSARTFDGIVISWRSMTNFRIASRFFAMSAISLSGVGCSFWISLKTSGGGLVRVDRFARFRKDLLLVFQFREADLQDLVRRQIDQFGLGQDPLIFFLADAPIRRSLWAAFSFSSQMA